MNKFYLLFLAAILVSCGRMPWEKKPDKTKSDIKNQLIERQEAVRSWAKYCGITAAFDRPGQQEAPDPVNCDTGDATLYNGLMCLSGETQACNSVAMSQGPNGRWWRSPYRVGFNKPNSFSRDMALGVLAYLTATKDQVRAQAWISYINSNGYKLCNDDTDFRCTITPGLWGLFRIVWEYIGLKPTNAMIAGDLGDETALEVSARTTPSGYQVHLVAVDLYLRYRAQFSSESLRKAEETLVERQPTNPFFLWLRDGGTDEIGQLVLDLCPVDKPEIRYSWAWSKDLSEQAWLEANGGDCIFMINLLTK